MLTLLMTGDVEIHEGVWVGDDEGRTDEDTEELVVGEVTVAIFGVRGFPFSHALEAFEDDAGVHRDNDAVVTEFAEETTIAVVDGTRHGTEIADVVVEMVAIYMVDGVASRDIAFEGQVLKTSEKYTTICPWY